MSKKLRNNAFFSTLSAQNKHIAFLPYGFIRHRNKESKGKLPLEIRTKMIMSRKLKNGSGKRAQARGYVVKVEI